MSSRGTKYKVLVDMVFNQPELFFRSGKVVRGWIIPEIDMKALAYHLSIGVGTTYIVRYGIQSKLKEIAKTKVEIFLKKSKKEGEVIIRLQQGELWSEHGPFNAEDISRVDPTLIIFKAARSGLVIPVSLHIEIREKIRQWIEEGKTG